MYCPQCQTEYREGFTECADCHVALVEGSPAEQKDAFDPDLGLSIVFETNSRIELAMVKGLFEEAGIPYFVLGQITTLVNDVDPFLTKWTRIQVPRDREAEARELLQSLAEAQPIAPGEEG